MGRPVVRLAWTLEPGNQCLSKRPACAPAKEGEVRKKHLGSQGKELDVGKGKETYGLQNTLKGGNRQDDAVVEGPLSKSRHQPKARLLP